jgi:2-polyprenyl-3-methyl-5-hydroxy-6-metoxy-1,4-benzoquinol methylase
MKYTKIQVKEILSDIIFNVYGKNPIILKDLWDATGEKKYIDWLHSQYESILLDFNEIFSDNETPSRVLEISSFLGVIDIALAKMGFDVYTYDIPEFQNNTQLKKLYSEYNVHHSFGYIKDIWKTGLPYPDNHFDAVIFSEVIEHLNMNPLPVLQEINRILKPDGILYITTPNQVNLFNRIIILLGGSIRNSISTSKTQIDQSQKTICGIHWREYTLKELVEILEITGFSIKKYSFSNNTKKNTSLLIDICDFFNLFFPSFNNSITVIGKKEEYRPIKFWFNDEYIKYYPN